MDEKERSSTSSTVLDAVQRSRSAGHATRGEKDTHVLLGGLTRSLVGSDGGGDDGGSCACELGCRGKVSAVQRNERKSAPETKAIRRRFLWRSSGVNPSSETTQRQLWTAAARKQRTSRKLGTNSVTEQEGDAATSLLVKRDLESASNGVLARVDEARKNDREALLVARGVALAKDLDDGLVREPIGDGLVVDNS